MPPVKQTRPKPARRVQKAASAEGGAPSNAELRELARQLRETAELLKASLAETPKAQDFQPLADHLYVFAESTPRLFESLDSARQAVGPLEAAARKLGDVADTLVATHQSWSESLLRLPRAEDYEPLAAPLREFARVSPALAETLGSVVRAVTPLTSLAGQLSESAEKLHALRSAAPIAPSAVPAPSSAAAGRDPLRPALEEAADGLAAAGAVIRAALDSLPRDAAYSAFASQLRELASVSPSLLEWLQQVPSLSLPLGDAIASLDKAARDLEAAEQTARRALEAAPRGRR
jgi:hypothetical protein